MNNVCFKYTCSAVPVQLIVWNKKEKKNTATKPQNNLVMPKPTGVGMCGK